MNILVVDDELDIKDLFLQKFRKEIRNNEMNFTFSSSGEEALECLKHLDLSTVLILSDINMPGISGLQLLSTIREEKPEAPPIIMMITAYGDDENRKQALSLGANDFLTKPLDFADLKEKLLNINNA